MPKLFVSSAACTAPPENESAHKKSFSRNIVQQNVEQKISPRPVVSTSSKFGNLIEYILSFTSKEIFCLFVKITFSIPNFCNFSNPVSSLEPVSAKCYSGFTLIAAIPSRGNLAFLSEILLFISCVRMKPCGSNNTKSDDDFIF